MYVSLAVDRSGVDTALVTGQGVVQSACVLADMLATACVLDIDTSKKVLCYLGSGSDSSN